LGLLQQKWDESFASIMVEIALALSKEYSAFACYTQSDEITLLMRPQRRSIAGGEDDKNELFEYPFGGKRDKLISLSSAMASSLLTAKWFHLAEERKVSMQSFEPVMFDCRLAQFDTPKEAFELILWRSYYCAVNGVSDAIHHASPKDSGLKTSEKLQRLKELNLLPLPQHQAHGTLIVKEKVQKDSFNPKTNIMVTVMRSQYTAQKNTNLVAMLRAQTLKIAY
jgi:tRNA(His) 5'-end guanylyltransferase